jgi:hypothetical protein
LIPCLGIYPKECKTGYSSDNCALIFIAALLTIYKLWKQSSYPITDEWIKDMLHIYTMEYYLAIRNNDMVG